ncbi:PAS domain S-box protein [Deinococcus marmoris]|uniref:PAS domain S-box protein n=1 Tax=Deinococcus marmoris TaxID=249408 RepID=UPI00068B31FC|nr:PAS domain S-box protein [Deinococcus marmoris]
MDVHPALSPDLHLLSQAFAASVTGVVITDAQQPDLPIIFVNPAFERLSGYLAAEIVGRNCRFLQGQDRDQDIRQEIRDALLQGQSVTTVLRNYRKDGSLFYNELMLSPIRDAAGTVTHFLGFQNDVTAREQARQQEARIRQQLTSTLERITDGFVSFDQDWNVTYVNAAAAAMTGRQPTETLGQNHFDLFPLSTHAPLGLALQKAQESGTVQHLLNHSAMGKQTDVTIYPGEDGVSMFIRDVTETRVAQQERQISQERFARVFETSPVAIFITRQSDKRFLEVNAEFSRQSGYTREEILGHSSQDLGLWADSADREVAWSMVDGDLPIRSREIPFRSRSGEDVYGVLSIIPMEVAGEACVIGFVRDITEEKQASNQFQASEERFARVFEASPVAIVVADLKSGHYLDVNAEFLRQSGYSREDVIGHTPFDLNIWVNLSELEDVGRTLQEEGKVLNREVQFRLKSGAVADTVISVVPVTIDGEACVATLIRDITVEKRARQALIESELHARTIAAELQHTLDLSVDLIASVGLDNRFLSVSAASSRILGYAPEELLGHSALDFIHPDDRAETFTEARYIRSEEVPTTFQNRYLHKNGSVVWLEWSSMVLPGDGIVYGVGRDVTQRRAADEDRAFLAAIVQASHNAIIGVSLDHTIRSWNPGAEELYGHTAEEAIGQPITFIVPADFHALELELMERASQGFRDPPFEGNRVTKNGEQIQVMVTISPILDAAGQVIGVSKIARNITALRKAEQEIQVLNEDLQRQLRSITGLRKIDHSIAASADLDVTLGLVLDNVRQQLGMDVATVLLFDPHRKTLTYTVTRGFYAEKLENSGTKLGVGLAGSAALIQQPISLTDLTHASALPAWRDVVRNEGLTAYYAVPLLSKGQVVGVLEVLHHQAWPLSLDWLSTLETLADQAAIAIDHARLVTELERSNVELRSAYDKNIEGWARALDLRDHETEGHSRRVTEMTHALCAALGFTPEQLIHVRRGALLHDIGKMGIPDAVLLKPGKLTEDEWSLMKKHPKYAAELLTPIEFLHPALEIPQNHHEKWDGSGYPRGLQGEAIPLAARAFAVVDVYDALMSDRPYRQAWTREKTMDHIQSGSGLHFDPEVVEVFVQMMEQP